MPDMITDLSLPGVRAFEAVARRGSFKAAADELHISPSAVSHAVAKLESMTGLALFERDGRAVRLTVSGEILMRHVGVAFDELRKGFDAVSATRGSGLLKLHSAPSFASGWLSPRLATFLAEHPGIEVRLSAGTDYARFSGDDFDIDIVYGPVRAAGVSATPLPEETVTPLCTPAMAEGIRSITDLMRHNLILSDNKQVRWRHWLDENGVPQSPVHGLRFDRSFLAISAAADGLGVALESTLLAEREIRSGRLVAPLAGICADVRYVGHQLVCAREARQRRPVRLFMDWMLREISGPSVSTPA